MSFIAAYWLVWVLGVVVFGGYALYTQFSFVKRGFNDPTFLLSQATGMLEGKKPSFFSHMGKVAAAGAVAWVFGILLAISIVVNIIAHFKS